MTQEEFERLAEAGNQGDSEATEALGKAGQQGDLRAIYWMLGMYLKFGKLNASLYEGASHDVNAVREMLKKMQVDRALVENDNTPAEERPYIDFSEVYIPEGTTRIGKRAFKGCKKITYVYIPNSVTSIGDSAFKGCSGLTTLIIPNSVTVIESSTFSECSSLTSVNIPNSVTSIDVCAFADCISLKSITIPDSVADIRKWAFMHCKNLSKIIVPKGTKNRFEQIEGLEDLADKIVEE